MLPVLASNAHNACGVDDDVCFDVFFLTSSTNSMTNGQTYFKTKTLPSHCIFIYIACTYRLYVYIYRQCTF